MLGKLADLIFPARCVGCGRRGALLCTPCRLELPYLWSGCWRCALPRGTNGETCRGCRHLSPTLRSLRAVCAYDGAARTAVHAFKFRAGRQVAPLLGDLMREHLQRRPLRAELVVPVPLAPGRRAERGYNQAELLAEQVVGTIGGQVAAEVLERADRPAQQTLSAADRLTNLSGAINARGQLAGERVVLIDDVATTGATLSACAEALTAAGAREVRALVFARDL